MKCSELISVRTDLVTSTPGMRVWMQLPKSCKSVKVHRSVPCRSSLRLPRCFVFLCLFVTSHSNWVNTRKQTFPCLGEEAGPNPSLEANDPVFKTPDFVSVFFFRWLRHCCNLLLLTLVVLFSTLQSYPHHLPFCPPHVTSVESTKFVTLASSFSIGTGILPFRYHLAVLNNFSICTYRLVYIYLSLFIIYCANIYYLYL